MISFEQDMQQSMERALIFGDFLKSLSAPTVEYTEHGEKLADRGQRRVALALPNAPKERVGARARAVARIIVRDGDDCCYCHKPLGSDMTIEHVVPRAAGGTGELSNLRLAHERCNQSMRDLPPQAKDAAAKAMRNQSTPDPRQLEPVGEARSFKGGM